MKRRYGTALRLLLLAVLTTGSMAVVGAAPASAAPAGCSKGSSVRMIGMWPAHYAWARCTSGSGKVQVSMLCPEPAGGSSYVQGPDVRVPGESRASCPDARKPTNVYMSLTS